MIYKSFNIIGMHDSGLLTYQRLLRMKSTVIYNV